MNIIKKLVTTAAISTPPTPEVAKLVGELINSFPLLDENGLDPYVHHCEWAIQQERIRLHSIIATFRNQNGGDL